MAWRLRAAYSILVRGRLSPADVLRATRWCEFVGNYFLARRFVERAAQAELAERGEPGVVTYTFTCKSPDAPRDHPEPDSGAD